MNYEEILALVKQGILEMPDAELVLFDAQKLGLVIISGLGKVMSNPDVHTPEWEELTAKAFRESLYGPWYVIVGLPVRTHVRCIKPYQEGRAIRKLMYSPVQLALVAGEIRQTLLQYADCAARQTAEAIALAEQ